MSSGEVTSPPIFITLGPEGTCHEHALLGYLEFQGLEDARWNWSPISWRG